MNPLPNILIVDDLEENLKYLEFVVKKFKVNLIRANSGSEALEKTKGIDIALAIIDVWMPEMNGYELAVKLNKNRTSDIMPVIFLTASMNNETEMLKGYNAGAVDYIFKPVNSHILTSKVSVFIDLYNQKQLLQQANADMEMKVNERTAEIAKVNFKLQIESNERQTVIEKEKELNMLKSRFISVISHEFRTPLTGIQSSVQLLERYGDKWDKEKKQKCFKTIYNSIRFTNLLLDDVSLIGKDESGKLNYNPSLCLIKEICRQAVDDLKAVFGNQQIINFSISSETIETFADESLLRHIINNLLSNAVKYSGHEKQIGFSVVKEVNDIVFTFTDHGIGIPEEDMKYVFEPFHRASNAETIKGTGLGLPIVKRCVDLLEGTIEINSTLNKGTTVVVKIPCAVRESNV